MRSPFLIVLLLTLLSAGSFAQSTAKGSFEDSIQPRSKAPAKDIKRYAIVAGISTYHYPIPSLNFAALDASRFNNFLKSGYAGKFEAIQYLPDTVATYGQLISQIVIWLPTLHLSKDDEIYIYYSGHGVMQHHNGGQYFLPADASMSDPSNLSVVGTLDLNLIRLAVRPLMEVGREAKIIFVFDACRKNEAGLTENAAGNSGYSITVDIPGVMEMLSASENQFSYETSQLKFENSGLSLQKSSHSDGSGVFSFFTLLGLYGAADRDPVDNKVTFAELKDFVGENVKRYVNLVLDKHENDVQEPSFRADDMRFVMSQPPPDTIKKYKAIYKAIDAAIQKKSVAGGGDLPGVINFDGDGLVAVKGIGVLGSPFGVRGAENAVEVEKVPNIRDTADQRLYGQFQRAVQVRHLVEPYTGSALSVFRQLEQRSSDRKLVEIGKQALFSSLLDHAQQVINDYLRGLTKNTPPLFFRTGYEELLASESLVPTNNFYVPFLRPKKQFLLARSLAGSNNPADWERGLRIVDSAIAADPGASYAHHTKARLYTRQNKYFSAIQSYETAIGLAPNWAYPLYSLADAYYSLGQYEKSIRYCREAIQKDSGYGLAYSLIALNYERENRYDSAIYWVRRAVMADSTSGDPYYYLGRIYGEMSTRSSRNLALSDSFYRRGAKLGDNGCYLAVADKFLNNNQIDSAVSYYKRILKKDPFFEAAYVDYAYVLSGHGRRSAADSLFVVMMGRLGGNGKANSDLAYFLLQTKGSRAADSIYNRAVAINPQDPDIFLDFAGCYETRKKDLVKARAILQEGLLNMPDNPRLTRELANFYLAHNKDSAFSGFALDSSLWYYRKTRSLTPENAYVYAGLYNVFLLQGETDSALYYWRVTKNLNKYIDSLYDLNPDILDMGYQALRAKKYDRALALFRMLAERSPNEYNILYPISLTHYLSGNLDSAIVVCDSAFAATTGRYEQNECDELKALILFDRKDYAGADSLFDALYAAGYNHRLNNLTRAACHRLGGIKADAGDSDPAGIDLLAKDEGIKYSSRLIATLKQVFNEK